MKPELRKHFSDLHQSLTDWQRKLLDLMDEPEAERTSSVDDNFLRSGSLDNIVRDCSGLTEEVYKALLGIDQGVQLPLGYGQWQADQILGQQIRMQNETGGLRTQPIAQCGVNRNGY